MDKKKQRLKELEETVQEKDFWKDKKKATEVSKEINDLKEDIGRAEGLEKETDELKELIKISKEDNSLAEDIEKRCRETEKRIQKEEIKVFLSGKYDKNNAILEIFSGAGGIDAQDWTTMLLRMFERYCQKIGRAHV